MNLPKQVVWSPGVPLEALIQQAVEGAMEFYKGNKTAVAQSLGIAVRTLDNRLDKYKKEKADYEQRDAEGRARRDDLHRRQRQIPPNAGFDTAATPSVHTSVVERRRAQERAFRESQAARSSAPAGVRLEPASDAPQERAVSVPVGEKVQSVLPKRASGNRS